MIRALIWPGSRYNQLQQPSNLNVNDQPTQIVLLGWQIDEDIVVDVTVKDHRVDEEAMQLFVVRDGI